MRDSFLGIFTKNLLKEYGTEKEEKNIFYVWKDLMWKKIAEEFAG